MACAPVMGFVVSFPWCVFSSRVIVAWLQIAFYICLLILSLWTRICLWRQGWVYPKSKLYPWLARCYPPVSSHFSLEALYVLFFKKMSYIYTTYYDHINAPHYPFILLPFFPTSILLHSCVFPYNPLDFTRVATGTWEWGVNSTNNLSAATSLQKMIPLSLKLPEEISSHSVSGRGGVLWAPSSSTMEYWGILILSWYISLYVPMTVPSCHTQISVSCSSFYLVLSTDLNTKQASILP